MKYLYFQDMHSSGNNPISRKGDFFEDILSKFDEILSIAKKHKVNAILDGGDIFHAPNPSYRILDEIADRVEKAGVTVYSLFGNHAELYHSIEHSQYTGLAHLQKRSKLFQYLNSIEDKDYTIKGIEYSHNIEEKLKEEGLLVTEESDIARPKKIWRIAIVHAFICPKPFPYALHIVCDDLKTNADIVLVAHYHSSWEKKVGDTQYIDIGCFGRRSINEREVKPSCIILDTDKRSYEIIALKSAKKGSEIFDLSKKEENMEFEEKIEAFISELKDMSVQATDIKSTIQLLGKKNKIENSVINLLVNKVDELQRMEN